LKADTINTLEIVFHYLKSTTTEYFSLFVMTAKLDDLLKMSENQYYTTDSKTDK
jgi:hypothetical protein